MAPRLAVVEVSKVFESVSPKPGMPDNRSATRAAAPAKTAPVSTDATAAALMFCEPSLRSVRRANQKQPNPTNAVTIKGVNVAATTKVPLPVTPCPAATATCSSAGTCIPSPTMMTAARSQSAGAP